MTYKRVLPFLSPYSPALTLFNGDYILAWTGQGGALNVYDLGSSIDTSGPRARAPARPVRLRESGIENESSIGQPALVEFGGRLILGWTGTDGAGRLNVISSADGKFFDQATKRTFPELSMAGPALEVYDGQVFIAWTGVDGRGTLNLMSARNGLDFGNKLILKDRHSIDESPSLAATLSSTAPVETRLHIGWTERGTNKVLFAEVMFNGGFVNNLDGFIFSAAGNPPYRGRQDVFSSVPPSLAGSFSLNVAWIAGNEHHVVWSASDLSSPGLGGLWSAPIEFKDSTDQPPALLADALNRPKIAWRGLDDKHSINTADMANMPTA